MSAIAGRVLLIPKGAYDANVTYHMLDVVSYGGNSYVAKQTTAGNTPSADNAYWMLLSAGSAVASINDIGDVLITSPTNGQVLKYNATSQKWENGQDTGGLLPHLIIISEDGESEVKAVKGSTEIIATRTSTGHYECDVPEFGTWTIHAVLNGDDATVNLVVDTVKVYTVDDSHFHADITVTYPSGGTCSCSKNGETTLYATGSPYTFTVHSAGAWTITVTAYGQTFTQTVNISESGQTAYTTVPNGATITPTDDIQILLACAGIGDSEITSLAELLDDTNALSVVINSNNAVDYMVRSTTWASIITVPTMTSNTTPEGECFADNVSTGHSAYRAFDGIVGWQQSESWASTSPNSKVGYIFPNAVEIVKVNIKCPASVNNNELNEFKVQYSDDGIVWNDATGILNFVTSQPSTAQSKDYAINSVGSHRYWAILAISSYGNQSVIRICEAQFYSTSITSDSTAMTYIGLNNYASNTLLADATWCNAICNSEYFESVLNVKVPTMTSNTTPEGACFAISTQANTYAYYAFDNNTSSRWDPLAENSSGFLVDYLGYKFVDTKNIVFASVVFNSQSNNNTMNWKIQGSNDNQSWSDISELQSTKFTASQLTSASSIINALQSYQYFRILIDTLYLDGVYFSTIQELQFYGREDV